VIGNKVKSAASGIWRWKGVELHYEEASVSNHGIFYACQDKTGERGVFMFLGQHSATPISCNIILLQAKELLQD